MLYVNNKKYLLDPDEERAREEGSTQATAGVIRSTQIPKNPYINTKPLYQTTSGKSTEKSNLLNLINLQGRTFTEYYNSGGYIPQGYQETARALAIEERRKNEFEKVLSGEQGYEDFLMRAYGKDLLKSQDVDLSSPLYWYNRVKQGKFDSPLDNDVTYMSILEAAEDLHKQEDWYRKVSSTRIDDTLLEPLLGTQVSGETFQTLFPDVVEAMGNAFDDDVNKILTYHKAGFLQGVFKPYIDTDGDGAYDYVLHIDGKLYEATEGDARGDKVQINYRKNADGSYALDEEGNRIVDSVEKAGWFGTSDVGQWFNVLSSSFVKSFTSLLDFAGLAYAGLAGMFDAEKTFGDYYAAYEAFKNSTAWGWLENDNTIMYDQGKESMDLKIASGVGTVLGIVAQAFLLGGGALAKKGSEAVAGSVAKTTGTTVIARTLSGAAIGAVAGAGIAYSTDGDMAKGAMWGALVGGALNLGAQGLMAKKATEKAAKDVASKGVMAAIKKGINKTSEFLVTRPMQLLTRVRSGSPFINTTAEVTRRNVWRKSMESALILSLKDGFQNMAQLESQNRVQTYIYDKTDGAEGYVMTFGEMLTKSTITAIASFGISTMLRASSGTTLSSRFKALQVRDDISFNLAMKEMSKKLGLEILDSAADIAENFLTAAVSSWGSDQSSGYFDGSYTKHLWSQVTNPTQILMSLYISANNHGLLRRVTGQESLNAERYRAVYGDAVGFQKGVNDTINTALRLMIDSADSLEAQEAIRATIDINKIKEAVVERLGSEGIEGATQATILLKTIQEVSAKVAELTGTGTEAQDSAFHKYLEQALKIQIDEAKKINSPSLVKQYKRMLKGLQEGGEGLSSIDMLLKGYFKHNYDVYKAGKYDELMESINQDNKAYNLFVKKFFDKVEVNNTINVLSSKEFKTLYKEYLASVFGRLAKSFIDSNLKLKDPATYNVLRTSALLNVNQLEAMIEQSSQEANKYIFKYFTDTDIQKIKQEKLDKIFSDGKYFNVGSLMGTVEEVTLSDGTKRKTYKISDELKLIISEEDNVEKLVKLGLIKEEDGQLLSVLPQSAFIKIDASKRNEMLQDSDFIYVLRILDVMSTMSELKVEEGGFDYDYPLITTLKSKHTNSEGKETDSVIYVVPNFDDIDFARTMSIIPSMLHSIFTAVADTDPARINTALIQLGLMASQDTATLSSKDLSETQKTEFAKQGAIIVLKYFNIGDEKIDIKSKNLVSRTQLLNWFKRGTDEAGNTVQPMSIELLKEIASMNELDARIIKNAKDLATYLDLTERAKEVVNKILEIDNARKKGLNPQLTAAENEKIVKFILDVKGQSKEIYNALVNDGVYSEDFKNYIDGTANFLKGQVDSGKITVEASKEIYTRLKSLKQLGNASQAEIESLVEQIYQSLFAENPELIFVKDDSLEKFKSGLRAEKRLLRKEYNKLVKSLTDNKARQGKLRKHLTLALINPDAIDNPPIKDYTPTDAEKALVKRYVDMIDSARYNALYQNYKDDIDTLYHIYMTYFKPSPIDGEVISLEEFKAQLNIKDQDNPIVKELTVLMDIAKPKSIEKPDVLSKETLVEVATRALELKFGEGTFDIEPTRLAEIDLSVIVPKGFSDVLTAVEVEARREAAFKNEKFDAELAKSVGGLIPHQVKAITEQLNQGKTKLVFNMDIPEEAKAFYDFLHRLGYEDVSEFNKEDIDGVKYNDELARGMEVKIKVKDAEGNLVSKTPKEILELIKSNVKIEYVGDTEEGKARNYARRLDVLSGDIVYVDDDTIVTKLANLLTVAPAVNENASVGVGKSTHVVGLSVKQGVAASQLAEYIKKNITGLTVTGDYDAKLVMALKLYSIVKVADSYYTGGHVGTLPVVQEYPSKGLYDEAKKIMQNNPLYNMVDLSEDGVYKLAFTVKDKENFAKNAFDLINKEIKAKGTVDIRKILPYFNLETIDVSEEYNALTKGGADISQLGDTGNVTTLSNWVMSQTSIQLDELKSLLFEPINNSLDMTELTELKVNGVDVTEALEGKTVKEVIEYLRTNVPNNLFAELMCKMLELGKFATEKQLMNNQYAGLSLKARKVLLDVTSRQIIGAALNETNGDVNAAYELIKTKEYNVYRQQEQDKRINVEQGTSVSDLRLLGLDSSIRLFGGKDGDLSLEDFVKIVDLMRTATIDNVSQRPATLMKQNFLLDVYNNLHVIDGKLVIDIDYLYKLGPEAIEELQKIGIEILNLKDIEDKRDMYEEISESGPIEIKGPTPMENAITASTTNLGFTETEQILAQLQLNRKSKPNKHIFVKASSIVQTKKGSTVDNLIEAYIKKLNATAIKTSNNKGSILTYNFNNEQALGQFLLSIIGGMKSLEDTVRKDGSALIEKAHLLNVAEAIAMYTTGANYSSEFTNVLIYDRSTGEVKPFSQKYINNLDFGRKLLTNSETIFDDARKKDYVLIEVSKNVLIDGDEANEIILRDLGNADTENYLRTEMIRIALDEFERSYTNKPETVGVVNSLDKVLYVYGRVVTNLDLLENLESSLSLRFGDSDIPDNVLRLVSPTIESLQSSSPDSSLSEEARRNTLHKMLMNPGQGIDNEEMKIFNDLTTYAITFEAIPDEVKNALMELRDDLDTDSSAYKYAEAYLKNDKEQMAIQMAALVREYTEAGKTTKEALNEVLKHVMLLRLEGKDLNAILMKNKSMLDVINKYEESKSAEDIAVQEVKSKLNKKITAFDVEALFKISSNEHNGYEGSRATEISFVTLDENTANQSLTDRARGSKNKVTIYIKYADINANDIGVHEADESADTLSDNKLYYKTTKGKENYLAQIAKGPGKYIDGDTTIYVVEGVEGAKRQIEALRSSGFFGDMVSYNGKYYDDVIMSSPKHLGIAGFETQIDFFNDVVKKYYSTIKDDQSSLTLENLKLKLIDGAKSTDQHTSLFDTLIMVEVIDKYLDTIENANKFTSTLGKDVLDIAGEILRAKGIDVSTEEEVFKILTSDTENFTFSKDFYGTKLASKSKYVSDYQNYGDRFSNEILEKLRQAEQELMNKYYLKTVPSQQRELVETLAREDLDFIMRFNDPIEVNRQVNTITKMFNIIYNAIGRTELLAGDEDSGFRGALVDTARMFKLIIEFQAERLGRPEEFNKVAEEFFTSSNEEQNQIIKDFANSGKFRSFGYTKPTDPSLEEQELIRATSLAEAITKKLEMFDSEEGKPINSEFFKEIKGLFTGDQGTSMASKVQQYTNRTSLKYQLMHAVQPLLNEVIKFVPDEFKDEAERLLTTWYGQTEDQKKNISDVRRLVINDAFTTMLLNGSESLGDHIMADLEQRMRTFTTYNKITKVPDGRKGYSNGYIYMSPQHFKKLFNAEFEDVVKAQYGNNPPEDAEIYIQIMRQPSYKEDNYHIMPIKIATWKNAAAISMTESTARHHHMGDFDGDGVSFSVSKDITNYGSKISKHVNLELNILDDVTKFLPLKTKAELNGYDKNYILNMKFNNKSVKDLLFEMYQGLEDPNVSLDKKRELISTMKSLIEKKLFGDNPTEEQRLKAKAFWKYYGAKEYDASETDAKNPNPVFYSQSILLNKDSQLAQNFINIKQQSSLFYDMLKIRDQAGFLQKQAIKIGEEHKLSGTDAKKRPFVYTPLNITDEVLDKIDEVFTKDDIRGKIVGNLQARLDQIKSLYDNEFSDAQLMLNQAHNYKEDGATFIQTFIQLIQDTVTTTERYRTDIINAYKESAAFDDNNPTSGKSLEYDYYQKIYTYAKSRNLIAADEEQLDKITSTIFDIQRESARLLEEILKINKTIEHKYAFGGFEGSDTTVYEKMLLNIALNRYQEVSEKQVFYCEDVGDVGDITPSYDYKTNKTYVNAKKLRIKLDSSVPTETVYVTSKGKQTTFSEVGVFEIPAGHTMSQEAFNAFKSKKAYNNSRLHNGMDYKGTSDYYVIGVYDKNKKPILNPTKDDIKDIRYVATSERYSLGMQDGLSSIKLGIPGTGVGKALVTPVRELTGLKDDPDVDLIMHPDLFKGSKYSPSTGSVSPVGEKQSIIEAKVAIAESTLGWNKDTQLKPIDMVTITNGRTNADGALAVGKFTFGFKGDDFYYDSTNVAKIAQLKSTAYARDYNTTNAARVYNFLRLSSLLKHISDSDWESSSFNTKSEFLKDFIENPMTGSDEYGNGIIASLVRRFLPGQKLDNFIETIKGDKTLSVLWSKQTRENFTNNFLDSITPTNTKSFIKKKKGYLEAEDKYYIPGVYEGELTKGLELSGAPTNERYHDNTMGHYDTLSFLNDIARANGIKEISTSTARALTKEGLVGVANQVPGSMPNGFNAFDIDDATRIEGEGSIYYNRGTTKTDQTLSDSPEMRILGEDDYAFSDEQITSLMTAAKLSYQNRTKDDTYKRNKLVTDDETYGPSLRKERILKTMLGILYPAKTQEERAYAFNSYTPTVRVSTSPKVIIGQDGKLKVAFMPNSSEVNVSDVKKTLYGNMPVSTYYDDVKKRTEGLITPARKQGIDITSVQPTLSPNDFFLKVLDTLKNKSDMVNTDAFKQTIAYTTLTTMYNRMLKGDNAIIEEEVSDYFKSLVGLKTSRLKKSLMTSSGIKGVDSYAVDRLVQNILPTQRRYAFELAGTEFDALITMFKRPEYAEAYKKFNEYVLILSHYERIQKATSNANVKSNTFILWNDLRKKSEDFLKERGYVTDNNQLDVDKLQEYIKTYEQTHTHILNAFYTIKNRIDSLAKITNASQGLPYGGTYEFLIDQKPPKQMNVKDLEEMDVINALSNTIDTLSRRAAFNMYIDGLKQEGRMSNIPVLAKVTELSDAFLKRFSEAKLHKNSEDFEKQSIVNSVLIASANELGYKLPDVYNLDNHGEILTILYRTVYNDIHKPGFVPYSELTKMYLENPNDIYVKELLSKHQLLQSIMGSMASFTSKLYGDTRKEIQEYFTTSLFNSIISDEMFTSGQYTLVDSQGRPYFTIDKKGNITFTLTSQHSKSFINMEDYVINLLKYDTKLNSQDDIKFNIITAIMNGDAYVMDKTLAETVAKDFMGMFPTKGIVKKTAKKVLQKTRGIVSSLIMSNPLQLLDRLFSQTVWDLNALGKNDLKTFIKAPKAKRELSQYAASKGAVASDELKLFVEVSGYKLGDMMAVGEAYNVMNNVITRGANELFNYQHYVTRYAAFLSLYEAAMKNGGNIPATKAGSAYYKLKEINSYNPKKRGLSEQENFKRNVALKAQAVISENIGTNLDMPHIAKGLGSWGAMFTTFPLAAMRGGVGKLKSLGYAIYDSFVNRSNISDNIKYLFTQLGNTLSVYAAHAILTYLTVNEFRDGVDNLFDDEDDDKERKEKEEQTWEMINKYLFNGALIKPFASILAGETVTTEYQNHDISSSLYQMFIDPFVDAAKDDDKETNSLTALKDIFMAEVWSRVNPLLKDPVESIKGNTEIQALPTYTNDKSFFENLLRKLSGYILTSAGSTALLNSYHADRYEDKSFLEKVGSGLDKALQAATGNNKIDKKNWRTYNKASSLIYEYKLLTSNTYNGDKGNDDSFSKISNEIKDILSGGSSPEALYELIADYLEEGVAITTIRSALRNNSIRYKLSQIDQEAFIATLTESKLNIIKQALAYERTMFPFLDEAIDYVEDEYEEWRDQTYGMDTPYQDAIARARSALYYQKIYQNYSDYYQKYNPYNTRLSNYRNYNYNTYTKSPLEVYNALDKNRKYEEQQRFYRERSKQYNK